MTFLRSAESQANDGWLTYEEGIGPVLVRTRSALQSVAEANSLQRDVAFQFTPAKSGEINAV